MESNLNDLFIHNKSGDLMLKAFNFCKSPQCLVLVVSTVHQ